jgi:hypothetical protein
MDIYDYSRLTMGEQTSLLWQKALYIDRHDDSDTTSCLYYLNNFYIEAVVSLRENRIVEVAPFKMGDRFEKYLMRVDLTKLS